MTAPTQSIFLLILMTGFLRPAAGLSAAEKDYAAWKDYLGTSDSAQYSALSQVNKSNVAQLKPAWSYPVGERQSKLGFNPLVVDDVAYILGKKSAITALNASTGKEIWSFSHPEVESTLRGFNYWESADRTDRRLFFASDQSLCALNALTGKPVPTFGNGGKVSLREGLGRDPKSIELIQSDSPGRIYRNLLILGSATGEELGSPPGDIRAYDVITGKKAWSFHTIPHPGEYGYTSWPKDAWKTAGGSNAWAGLSLDEKRGIVYVPTGSAVYDFYGGDRKGDNLFSNCLIALDARTGKRLWHRQLVHHDLWDYDLPDSPKLLRIRVGKKDVDAVAQATKQGFLFVFDRVTGKPIWPIEERPVPKSEVPQERASPTQPFPLKPPPFARQRFTDKDLSPYVSDPTELERVRGLLKNARNEGVFTPPSLRDTIQIPGSNGGANWGSAAAEPGAGMVYVVSKDHPAMLALNQLPSFKFDQSGSAQQRGRVIYSAFCLNCHGPTRSGSPPLIPSLAGVVDRLGAEEFQSIVKSGRAQMPGFSNLAEGELKMLGKYLQDPAGADAKPLLKVKSAPPGNGMPRFITGFGFDQFVDQKLLLPAIAPPWSTPTAYDLNQGKIKWQVPLGEVPTLAAKGIRNTGGLWPRGGPVVTAGGLIFVGTKSDGKVRAFDKDTGAVLWESQLPGGPEGVPAIYQVAGKQYIAFSTWTGDIQRGLVKGLSKREKDTQPEGEPAYHVFSLP